MSILIYNRKFILITQIYLTGDLLNTFTISTSSLTF